MTMLGNGLSNAGHPEDALSVQEAELSMLRRLGVSEEDLLGTQSNLSNTYLVLGRLEDATRMMRAVYSGRLKLSGEENLGALMAANNYANSLVRLRRFEEARSLLRKTIPVARRVLGESHEFTLKMRSLLAQTVFKDDGATLDDLRESVTTLEDTERTARRVFGGANPLVVGIEINLRNSRAALAARKAPVRGDA